MDTEKKLRKKFGRTSNFLPGKDITFSIWLKVKPQIGFRKKAYTKEKGAAGIKIL